MFCMYERTEVRTRVRHGDDVYYTRSIHHEIGIGRDMEAGQGVTDRPDIWGGKMRRERGMEKEVGRDF